MSVVAIPGQPGLFRDERRSYELADYLDGHVVLRDIAASRASIAVADAKFNELKSRASKLLAIYGPLDQATLDRFRAAVRGKGPGFFASMGAAEFAGLIRLFLSASAYNINIAHALLNGPDPESRETTINLLISTAMNLLAALDTLVRGAQATQDAIASVIRTAGSVAQSMSLGGFPHGRRGGLRDLGFEPVEIVAGLVVIFIVVAALAYAFTQWEAAQSAAATADAACDRAAAAGSPCTAADYARIHDQALEAATRLSIIPNIGQAISSAGSLFFWGGLAIVGAAVAYGAWVAAPAATTARERLRAGAARL